MVGAPWGAGIRMGRCTFSKSSITLWRIFLPCVGYSKHISFEISFVCFIFLSCSLLHVAIDYVYVSLRDKGVCLCRIKKFSVGYLFILIIQKMFWFDKRTTLVEIEVNEYMSIVDNEVVSIFGKSPKSRIVLLLGFILNIIYK